jgi:hypothetical protein
LLIDSPSFPPIAGTEDADAACAIDKAHRHHAASDDNEAKVSRLGAAMFQVLGDNAVRIEERRPALWRRKPRV